MATEPAATEPAATEPAATEPAATEPAAEPLARRELDVVLFGATGFVGRLTAEHLAEHAPSGTRIGLAGRSAERLTALRRGLGPVAAGWPLLVADVDDPESLVRLARSASVVATTVGPYARYGLPLVLACAEAGTHYADLTGEVLFVRRSIDLAHEAAVATGARIVHSCGFDSVPSDLAVLLAHQQAVADGAGELIDTTLTLVSARGGFSGGTVDSLRTQIDEVQADGRLADLLADPYALSPDRGSEPELGPQPDRFGVQRDRTRGGWTGPFVMAGHNTRIVRRSNALQDWSYGRRFRYREVMAFGTSPIAPALAGVVALGLRGVEAGLRFGPTRAVLDRVLPAPGAGPGEQARRTGHFRLEVRAMTTTGVGYTVTVAAQGDPGYAATAVMLGQSALSLAAGGSTLPAAAGVLTPATAIGSILVDRLRQRGFQFDIRRVEASGRTR